MENIRNLTIPILQFRSQSIIAYNEYVFERSGIYRMNLSRHLSEVREKYKTYSGEITKGAKKRMTKAITLLVQSSRQREIKNPVTNKWQSFKLSFITLTIPENNIKPDARFTNKFLLEPFIRVLRRRYGLKNYVWKLELQKNGMIHYHLTSDIFIVHSDLKNEWNNILRKNDMLKDYKARTGKNDPNSTDIHSVKNIKNLEAYLVKYVTKKDDQGRKVNGKIWDCSMALKKSNYFNIESTTTYQKRLQELENRKEITSFAGERFVIFKFKQNPVHVLLNENCLRKYYIHNNQIRNYENEQKRINASSVSTSNNFGSRKPSSTAYPALPPTNEAFSFDYERTQKRIREKRAFIPPINYQTLLH